MMLQATVQPTTQLDVAVIAAGYLFLLLTSGVVVRTVLGTVDQEGEQPSQRERDVGLVVGKAENVLTLTFILVGAYTALAVVFAAKNIIRKDDIEKNSLFYLAGTLVNFTYSVVVGVAMVAAVAVV
jgi:hypothetical protein